MLSVGDTVKVHYTGKYLDGKVFDTTVANEPILFTIGDEMMIPGFEDAVLTMVEGEQKSVTIKAADAYGEFDKDLLVEVNRQEVFGDKEVKVGDTIQAPTDDGVMMFKVHEVGDEKVILDGNSEMAGKDVVFDIELIEVRKGEGVGEFSSEMPEDEFTNDYGDEEGFEFEDGFDIEQY